jgi:hypothetical protein
MIDNYPFIQQVSVVYQNFAATRQTFEKFSCLDGEFERVKELLTIEEIKMEAVNSLQGRVFCLFKKELDQGAADFGLKWPLIQRKTKQRQLAADSFVFVQTGRVQMQDDSPNIWRIQ